MKVLVKNRSCLVFVSCLVTQICAQLCRTPCYCPWIPPRCPVGVPLIMDGCGCCRICARRLGESCNQIYPCDQTQELTCDFSTSMDGRDGTCNYNHDGNCEHDGKVYQDGETFQPSCKFQCKCLEGGVTCTPLCSEDILLPTPECPSPKRVGIPGKCCQEWICDGQQNRISSVLVRGSSVPEGSPRSRPFTCTEWSTEWSACSVSCDMGVSMRVSNKNSHCRLEMQSRLCIVRPCRGIISTTNMGSAGCTPTVFSSHPIRFEIQDCISVKTFKAAFCGSCGVRQCVPYQTSNELVDFQCRTGITRKMMMFIHSCVCY
ncbi:WNT1-inducible-signaling pathway 2 [Pelobates cultripes]|uniref:WNT1-inducible-signaling pathway 2 n=1 Tax=Pelobates cultripes TaxID=61616 RepID=A0AAD1SP15_PELCU|nr:WNT1-inducible-signaling pathway 2 [Pelobates cultripes]